MKKVKLLAACLAVLVIAFGISTTAVFADTQLTFSADHRSQLDNNLNFSPDGQWLAYDTRAFEGGLRNTQTLEKVNVNTKEIVVMHQVADPVTDLGPGTGAVSFFPGGDKVIAIHGFPTSTGLRYEGYQRFGAIVSPTDGSAAGYQVADARDVTEPFTPGALRGGSHRHEPSGDGQWIGFTYNDKIMRENGTDLRTVGVTKLGTPVTPNDPGSLGNQSGLGFTVLVAKVVPNPTPDTEEISKASDDAWVGDHGYQKPDSTWQRARAFIGKTKRTVGGNVVDSNQLFVVDIPEDITVPGPDGPLEGTATTFPMPPAGTVQRMLTDSDSQAGGIVRASKDGSRIAFVRDGQINLVSPLGNESSVVQATSLPGGTYKPWWHPSGDYIASISQAAIWATNVKEGDPDFGKSWPLTQPTPDAWPDALVVSPDGKFIAFNRALDMGRPDGNKVNQIFITPFVIPEPSTFVLAALGLFGALALIRRRDSAIA